MRTECDLQQQTDPDSFLVAWKIFSLTIFIQLPSSQDETLRKNIHIQRPKMKLTGCK